MSDTIDLDLRRAFEEGVMVKCAEMGIDLKHRSVLGDLVLAKKKGLREAVGESE